MNGGYFVSVWPVELVTSSTGIQSTFWRTDLIPSVFVAEVADVIVVVVKVVVVVVVDGLQKFSGSDTATMAWACLGTTMSPVCSQVSVSGSHARMSVAVLAFFI